MSAPTLGSARRLHCWLWLICPSPACRRARPVALAPFIIRWGADAPIERLRRAAICSACGHKGALLQTPSWHNMITGWAPFPVEREGSGERGY